MPKFEVFSIPKGMNHQLSQIYDPELFRERGHQIIDLLADYLAQCKENTSMDIMPKKQPHEVLDYWKNELSNPANNLVDYFEKIIQYSTKIHHPKYIGHQVAAPAPISVLSDLLGAFLNNGMAVFEMGATSSAMEKIVMDWLAAKIGWKEGGGVITSGGSLANLTAILAARQAKAANSWNDGNPGSELALMVSEEAHYCVERAVKILGWGSSGIIKIPTDEKFKIKPELLEDIYKKETEKGKKIIAVVGSACSTSTGSYDPLNKIGEFCKKHNLWFHVDAAHGGPIIFSQKFKHRATGIEMADSVVMDFHKMMMVPALATALVFKNESDAYETFAQKASYLLADEDHRWYDSGLKTIECTKRMISTKIFTLLKFEGENVFDEFVTYTHDLAVYFSCMIKSSKDFELAVNPESNIVCFRYVHQELDNNSLNALNEKLRNQIISTGTFYIVKTVLRGKSYLRITIMSPFTKESHLDELLTEIRSFIN